MSKSYVTLCQDLRREVGISGSGPNSVTSQTGMFAKIVEWVAEADYAIQTKWSDWGFLWETFTEDTIASTNLITAPTDINVWDEEMFFLDFGTDTAVKLVKMDYRKWRSVYYSTAEEGTPSFFIVRPDKNIILEPTPDDVYELTAEYWKTPTKMTANTDTSPVPFDRLIIAQAKIYYAEHENAPEVMNAAVNEYAELMHRLEAMYLQGQEHRTKSSNEMMIIPE